MCCTGARNYLEYMHVLTDYLQTSKSIETIDLQCNELGDKHQLYITKVICAQYELKDVLRWKLGLRNPDTLNVSKLGVKKFVLSRNNFGDVFAYHLGVALKSDEYVKSVCLKKNKIGFEGIKNLAEACHVHPFLLSVDLRDNSGYTEKKS